MVCVGDESAYATVTGPWEEVVCVAVVAAELAGTLGAGLLVDAHPASETTAMRPMSAEVVFIRFTMATIGKR